MQSRSPEKNNKQPRDRRRDKSAGGEEGGATERSSTRRTEVTEGDSAHEVHEGKLIRKPATESGK